MNRKVFFWMEVISFVALSLFCFQSPPGAYAAQTEPAETIDWVDIAYRKAKIISGHATPEETFSLLNQLLDLGHLDTVQGLLENIPPFPSRYLPARLDLVLRLNQAQYFRHQEDSNVQKKDRENIEKILRQLVQTTPLQTEAIARYEQTAEQFNLPETVVAFCLRLARSASQESSRWWLTAGQWTLASPTPGDALPYFDKAVAAAASTEQRRQALISKLNAQWKLERRQLVIEEIEAAIVSGKDEETLEDLARFALGIERPDLAWRLYGRLTTIAEDQSARFREETVRWAIAANQPLKAAGFLENLPPDTFPADHRDDLLYDRFTLLRHGNQTDQAMTLARKLIGHRPEDDRLLEDSVQLALSARNMDDADQWNRQLLQLKPQDEMLLKRQADISIARKDPQKAVEIVRQLYQMTPRDETLLHQLAKLEEWTGNAETSLVHLKRLSRIQNRLELHEQVYRLSRAINDHESALEALGRIAALRRLSRTELNERIYLYENLGAPEKAVAKTMIYLHRNPDDYQTWLEVAHLQMRTREYRQAIATWESVANHFGRHTEETLYRAECFWRMGKKRGALAVIDSFQGPLTSPDNLYHANLLVEMGWRYRRPELALPSLTSLLEHYDRDRFFIIERIIHLQYENGSVRKAVRIAVRSARQTQDRRFLLLALRLADAGLDQQQVDALLQEMNKDNGSFDSTPLYWTIQAHQKYIRQDYRGALNLYRKALAMDENSPAVKDGILWCLLSLKDRENLSARLKDWRKAAHKQPDLWMAYAASNHFLGEYRQAGIWYEHLLFKSHREEYGVVLGYADVLEIMGAEDRAYRLRIWAMERLRGEAEEFLAAPENLTETLKSYVALMQRYGGAEQVEYWLETIKALDHGRPPSPWLYETAVSWYLNSHRCDQAKIWLAEAHKERIQTAQWQQMTIALTEKNQEGLKTALAESPEVDPETEADILTALDLRREAFHTAESGIDPKRSAAQISAARWRAAALKPEFPAYLHTGIETTVSDQLERREARLSARYSLTDSPLGVGVNVRAMEYLSDLYLLNGHDRANDLSLTAYLGDGEWGGSATAGFNQHEAESIGYGRFEYHQQLASTLKGELKLELYSVPQVDSVLQLAALQNRLDAAFSGTLMKNYYYYLDLWGREYVTRNDLTVAQGYGGTTEIGFKQHWGRFQWSVGLQGITERNTERRLPDELAALLPENTTVDSVVAREASGALVGGRICRGDIGEEHPGTGSLRYFISAWVGRTWPQNKPTANVHTGAGTRLFGNDELSLEAHYNQAGDVVGRNDDSGLSLNYRYHF